MVVDRPLLFEAFEPVSGRVRSQTFGERMARNLSGTGITINFGSAETSVV